MKETLETEHAPLAIKPDVPQWRSSDIEALLQTACERGRPAMAVAACLAMLTGGRLHTILEERWSQISEDKITGLEASLRALPVRLELRKILSEMPRTSQYIIADDAGRRYQPQTFLAVFCGLRDSAGLARSLRFQDLRHFTARHLGIWDILGHQASSTMSAYLHFPRNSRHHDHR